MSNNQIRITNLNFSATEDDIKNYISSFAQVKEIKLVKDIKNRSKGLAYVTLEQETDYENALKKDGELFQDRKIKIQKAIPQDQKKPKENTTKAKTQKPKTEKTPKSEKIHKEDNTVGQKNPKKENKKKVPEKNQKQIDFLRKIQKYRRLQQYFKIDDEYSVQILNLSFKCTELLLGQYFEKCGEIKNVKILYDYRDLSLGVGYVQFDEKQCVQEALKLNASNFEGREIKVRVINREYQVRKVKEETK